MTFIIKAKSGKYVGYLNYEWVGNTWIFATNTAYVFSEKEEEKSKDGVEKAFRSRFNSCFSVEKTTIEKVEI